jgi:hypothetical protein
MKIDKVLVPLDGSRLAEQPLTKALEVAEGSEPTAWQALYGHHAYNSFPRHVRSMDVGFVHAGGDIVSAAWFTARLDEALKTAGPRYTPEVHVDLPIAGELEAFGRTERHIPLPHLPHLARTPALHGSLL